METTYSNSVKNKVCKICGKEFDIWDEQEDFGFNHHVGYGSKFDGSVIELNMCCNCFDKLMEYIIPQCSIPPIVKELQ